MNVETFERLIHLLVEFEKETPGMGCQVLQEALEELDVSATLASQEPKQELGFGFTKIRSVSGRRVDQI